MSRTKADKRQKVSSDEEDDDLEQQDDDLEMLMDEEERERFNQMSEKEREIEIFKRLEQREINKTREQIKRKLEIAAGKKAKTTSKKRKRHISEGSDAEASAGEERPTKSSRKSTRKDSSDEEGELPDVDDTSEDEEEEEAPNKKKKKKAAKDDDSVEVKSEIDDFDAEYHKPSELANKHNKKKAMADLLSKRRHKKQAEEKRKKDAQHAAQDLDDIFGNDDDGDGKSLSSSSSSTTSSRSSSPASRSRTPSPVAIPISTREQLVKAQAIRRRLARIVHAPFFSKVVIGCFVRVQIGSNEGKPTYRIAQVVDVVETAKIYEVEPGTEIRTNKGFKLKICNNDAQRVIRLEFVSNGEFLDTEYAFWLKRMQETGTPLPTVDFVERKQKELVDALNYNYTDAEINLMVKEKQRFKRQPTNFAFQKAELLKQKEEAEQNGDTERVRDLQQQINDFEEKAKKIENQRNKSLMGVTAINQRNREHMKHIFLNTDRLQQSEETSKAKDDDPFTRKSARMKMVTGGLSKAKLDPDGVPTAAQQLMSSSSLFPSLGATKSGGAQQLPVIGDLFSAHGIDINIDLNKVLPATTSSAFRAPPIGASTSQMAMSRPAKTASTRTLTLEEYKRKYNNRLT